MQNISDYNFNGKKAIVRVDFNVPLNDKFEITDDTRIRAAIPTLKKVLAGGGSLIVMSHLGRPKGVTEKYSLKHIIYRVEELLGVKIQFADDCQKAQEQAAVSQLDGNRLTEFQEGEDLRHFSVLGHRDGWRPYECLVDYPPRLVGKVDNVAVSIVFIRSIYPSYCLKKIVVF